MEKVIMKCGHSANATYGEDRKPCCVICAGINPDAYIVDENSPDLSKRKAKCCYCNNIVPSNLKLAFFRHRPTDEYDEYYCGCFGWD